MTFIRNLFTGPCGTCGELGRVCAAIAVCSFTFAFLYALIALKAVPDWQNLGTGFGLVLAGAGALIYAKDVAQGKAATTQQGER